MEVIYFDAGTQHNLVTIGEDSGVISVQPINRDELKQEIFTFTVSHNLISKPKF